MLNKKYLQFFPNPDILCLVDPFSPNSTRIDRVVIFLARTCVRVDFAAIFNADLADRADFQGFRKKMRDFRHSATCDLKFQNSELRSQIQSPESDALLATVLFLFHFRFFFGKSETG